MTPFVPRRARRRRPVPYRVLISIAVAAVLLVAMPARAAKEPKKRVAVTAFENKAGYYDRSWGDVGQAMGERLVEALIQSDKFVVLERLALRDVLGEQDLDAAAKAHPEVSARLTSAQALIRGVVTNIESTEGAKSKLGFRNIRLGGGASTVEVTVNIRIVDVVTGQVLQSKTVHGKARKRNALISVRTRNTNVDTEGEQKLPIGRAVDEAIDEAVKAIVAGMEKVEWQGSIARVSGRQVFVNAGSQENVEPGLQLRVFEKGVLLIDSETNEDLGRLDEEIGVIEVEEVRPKFSIARIVEGQGFAAGNIVKPVSVRR